MLATLSTYFFSLVAGGLSTLSPCVLPLIPILITSALNTHKLGPFALAGGLALSFTVVGVFLATLGASLGLDQDTFRIVAASLLIGFGVILLSAALQERFAVAASGISNSGQSLLNRISTDTLGGQFLLGLILGVVWSPCVGPTLGAAITLASQGESLGHITLVMALFGIGAGIPLILLGLLSRQAMMRFRDKLLLAGQTGKKVLGVLLLLVGIMIIFGWDKQLESAALDVLPTWLVNLSVRY
jgi:cytochrome c-type biogenesis protein